MNSLLKQRYMTHLDSILQMYIDASYTEGNYTLVSEADAIGIIARATNAIKIIAGENSTYWTHLSYAGVQSNLVYEAELIIGLVKALRSELNDGLLTSYAELVRGEMFDDYLQMATYLLGEGYKDPAAIIAGTTLEVHIKELAKKYDIPLEGQGKNSTYKRHTETLNQDLGKSGAYSMLDQKLITGWLELRNNAAHGNFAAYDSNKVEQFTEWLQDFIAKNPA